MHVCLCAGVVTADESLFTQSVDENIDNDFVVPQFSIPTVISTGSGQFSDIFKAAQTYSIRHVHSSNFTWATAREEEFFKNVHYNVYGKYQLPIISNGKQFVKELCKVKVIPQKKWTVLRPPVHPHPNFFGNLSLTWTDHSNYDDQQLLIMSSQTKYTWYIIMLATFQSVSVSFGGKLSHAYRMLLQA